MFCYVLYCIVLYCIVLYCIVLNKLYCNVLCCIIRKLDSSSLPTRSAGHGGHSIVEKPQRHAVAARWCPSPLGKDDNYMSECEQHKCCRLPQSHEFNIIENIWDELNRRVRRTGSIPSTLNELRAKNLYEWNNLPQNYVQRYVTSMRRRCVDVVNSAGGHTRY